MPSRTTAIACLVVTAALTGVTACSGSGSSAGPAPTTAPSFSVSPCPVSTAAAKAPAWPAAIPKDLPKPLDATIVGTQSTPDGIKIVRYTTPTSLREAVLFVVERYKTAGYILGRGDAEATEADAPFVKGTTRGITRLASLENCKTLWLTATVKATGPVGPTTPILPSRTPSGSASPLPFG
jgi:hypothetical protein